HAYTGTTATIRPRAMPALSFVPIIRGCPRQSLDQPCEPVHVTFAQLVGMLLTRLKSRLKTLSVGVNRSLSSRLQHEFMRPRLFHCRLGEGQRKCVALIPGLPLVHVVGAEKVSRLPSDSIQRGLIQVSGAH